MVYSPRKKCFLKLERLEVRDCPTAGALDTTFGGTGYAFADFGAGDEIGMHLAIQSDGKTVVAGNVVQLQSKKGQQYQYDFAVARFNVDGSLDTTFGPSHTGKVLTDFQNFSLDQSFSGVAIQPDGKIVVGGRSDNKFAVARYNTDGTLDTSFDGDGKVTTSLSGTASIGFPTDLVLQPDGKILICGNSQSVSGKGANAITSYGFSLVMYNVNGSLDTSFDGDGIAYSVFTTISAATNAHALALQSNGQIVVSGNIAGVAAVARFNANGSLDTSFGGGDGHVEFTDCSVWVDVALQPDVGPDPGPERIVVCFVKAPTTSDPLRHPLIARYTSAGILDTTFGSNGVVVETAVPLARFNGGYNEVEIQADGKIVAGGGADLPGQSIDYNDEFVVARYLPNGDLDTSFSGGIVLTDTSSGTTEESARDIAIDPTNGKIVAAGRAADASGNSFFAVVRYLGDDPAPLQAAALPTKISNQTITQADMAPLLIEAIRRCQSAGFDISALTNIEVRIADLPGSTLGQAQGATITLDANAAGWGWFVDPTPGSDSEFFTPGNQGEQNRMDVLTALGHELGHVLGHDHDEGSVMAETLSAGTRLMPFAHGSTDWLAAVDQMFATDWYSGKKVRAS